MYNKEFDESTLRKEIVRIWGEYSAHVEVFDYTIGEIERLREKLAEMELSKIEAQNPGIDMEELKAFIKGRK